MNNQNLTSVDMSEEDSEKMTFIINTMGNRSALSAAALDAMHACAKACFNSFVDGIHCSEEKNKSQIKCQRE